MYSLRSVAAAQVDAALRAGEAVQRALTQLELAQSGTAAELQRVVGAASSQEADRWAGGRCSVTQLGAAWPSQGVPHLARRCTLSGAKVSDKDC